MRTRDQLEHWVWLERLERKWSIGKYGGGHWRYRYPVIQPEHYAEQYDVTADGSSIVPED